MVYNAGLRGFAKRGAQAPTSEAGVKQVEPSTIRSLGRVNKVGSHSSQLEKGPWEWPGQRHCSVCSYELAA
jgi:hypothetical protein